MQRQQPTCNLSFANLTVIRNQNSISYSCVLVHSSCLPTVAGYVWDNGKSSKSCMKASVRCSKLVQVPGIFLSLSITWRGFRTWVKDGKMWIFLSYQCLSLNKGLSFWIKDSPWPRARASFFQMPSCSSNTDSHCRSQVPILWYWMPLDICVQTSCILLNPSTLGQWTGL